MKSEENTVRCQNCNHENPAESKFCAFCGSPLVKKNKNKKWPLVLVLCMVIVIISVLGVGIANRLNLIDLPFLHDSEAVPSASAIEASKPSDNTVNDETSDGVPVSKNTDIPQVSNKPVDEGTSKMLPAVFSQNTDKSSGEAASKASPSPKPTSTPRPTAVPSTAAPISREEVCEVFKDPSDWHNVLILDTGNNTYTLTVNLLEGWGTVVGSYSEDSNGTIRFEIDEKSFAGVGDDDISAFHFQRNGGQITIPSSIWTLQPGYMSFSYDQDIVVDPLDAMGTVTGDAVRIRSGPSTDDMILWEVDLGATVQVTGKCSDWYRIGYTRNGYTLYGFMSADYIDIM